MVCHFPYRKGKDMATMIQKLVEAVAAQNNGGMIIKVVGLSKADNSGAQEVKVVKTSRNANPYRLMQKHGLVEVWIGKVHYVKEKKKQEGLINFSEYFQLVNFGVLPHRAKGILMAAEKGGQTG